MKLNDVALSEAHRELDRSISMDPAVIEQEFCAIWPKAKPLLAALAPMVAFIPNAGPAAAAALKALVSMAEHIAEQRCKG